MSNFERWRNWWMEMKGDVEMNLFKHKASILFGTPTYKMETIFYKEKKKSEEFRGKLALSH